MINLKYFLEINFILTIFKSFLNLKNLKNKKISTHSKKLKGKLENFLKNSKSLNQKIIEFF